MTDQRLYHGGIPGLQAGDKILPPSITGKSTLLEHAISIAPDGPQCADLVYLTSDPLVAEMFASLYPYGTVYEVAPDGLLEPDPDCYLPGLSYQCPSATVMRVISENADPALFAAALLKGSR